MRMRACAADTMTIDSDKGGHILALLCVQVKCCSIIKLQVKDSLTFPPAAARGEGARTDDLTSNKLRLCSTNSVRPPAPPCDGGASRDAGA